MERRCLIQTAIIHPTKIIKVASTVVLMLLLQSICFGQVYSYTDVSQTSDSVMGYGYVTGYYNSSTYVYTTRVTVTSPSGRSTTVTYNGNSATAYLGLEWEHGNFTVSTTHFGTCPYGSNHPIGGSGGSISVTKYCSLRQPYFVGNVTPADLKVSVTCSRDPQSAPGSTTVTVSSYAVEPVGEWTLKNIPESTNDIPDGASREYTFKYERDVDREYNCPQQGCSCKGEARMEPPTGATVSGTNPARTTSSIAIQ